MERPDPTKEQLAVAQVGEDINNYLKRLNILFRSQGFVTRRSELPANPLIDKIFLEGLGESYVDTSNLTGSNAKENSSSSLEEIVKNIGSPVPPVSVSTFVDGNFATETGIMGHITWNRNKKRPAMIFLYELPAEKTISERIKGILRRPQNKESRAVRISFSDVRSTSLRTQVCGVIEEDNNKRTFFVMD